MDNTVKNHKLLLRAALFLVVLAIAVYHLQGIFAYNNLYTYEDRTVFETEKRGRLDGVYIGGSDVFSYWQPLFGWRDHGIAIENWCANSMRAVAVQYFIEVKDFAKAESLLERAGQLADSEDDSIHLYFVNYKLARR